jgi:hypothetical protein
MGAFFDSFREYASVSGVDCLTFLVALAYGRIMCNRKPGQAYISRETGLSILHGLVIFPLFLIAFSAIYPPVLPYILGSNKLLLAAASLLALFSMFENPKT